MDISITTILQHIGLELPYAWIIITSATFFAGLYFAFRAIIEFKKYADAQGTGRADIRKPIFALLAAIALLYWPTLVRFSMESVFSTTVITPYQYMSGKSQTYNLMMKTVGMFVQIIGYFSFIRGWIILTEIGRQGGKPGQLSRALIHIIAGLLAVNIFGTWEVFKSIIGIS